jgi:hypothetical protein
MSPRQSPSSLIRSSIIREADFRLGDPLFFVTARAFALVFFVRLTSGIGASAIGVTAHVLILADAAIGHNSPEPDDAARSAGELQHQRNSGQHARSVRSRLRDAELAWGRGPVHGMQAVMMASGRPIAPPTSGGG